MFVPSVRYHTINTSCQNLPKAIYKTVIPDTEFSHAFLFGNKTMQRCRCSRRKFMTTASVLPAVGPQSRIYRTVSETPQEVWKTVLRGNRRKQGKSPKRSLSRNSSHKTRKTSQKTPQKTTRRLPDDISHVYAVQCMPQRENRRRL